MCSSDLARPYFSTKTPAFASNESHADIIIVGSGVGGGTPAGALAGAGVSLAQFPDAEDISRPRTKMDAKTLMFTRAAVRASETERGLSTDR